MRAHLIRGLFRAREIPPLPARIRREYNGGAGGSAHHRLKALETGLSRMLGRHDVPLLCLCMAWNGKTRNRCV